MDNNNLDVQKVRVTDIDISFGQMVGLMVKATIACIPAAIILMTLAAFAGLFLGSIGLLAK